MAFATAATTLPAVIVKPPLNVFTPPNVSVPAPDFVIALGVVYVIII